MYYNTNKEKGETLMRSRRKALRQEDMILAFFLRHPGVGYSPEEIRQHCLISGPLTSVRRAMTNLANDGKLRKTDKMKEGGYGKMVHTWELVQHGQIRMF